MSRIAPIFNGFPAVVGVKIVPVDKGVGVKNDTHVRTTFLLLWVLKKTPVFAISICHCGY